MKIIYAAILFTIFLIPSAQAQYASQQDARNIAILKAVVNYKIDDEENIRAIEQLRQDKNFNMKLQKMLNKLSNKRTKNADNRKVLDILEKAGNDIYNVLN